MMKLTSLLFITLTLLTAAVPTAAKVKGGTAVVDASIAKFEAAPSISAGFTVRTTGAAPVSGEITLSGNSFKLIYPGFEILFNGKTQWTYDESLAEVSVTEPTPGELAELNPFIIVSSLRTAFTSVPVSTTARSTTVKFIPARKSDGLESMLVTFDNLSSWPSTIKILRPDGASAEITLTGIRQGRRLPTSTFTWKPVAGVAVNDLR